MAEGNEAGPKPKGEGGGIEAKPEALSGAYGVVNADAKLPELIVCVLCDEKGLRLTVIGFGVLGYSIFGLLRYKV